MGWTESCAHRQAIGSDRVTDRLPDRLTCAATGWLALLAAPRCPPFHNTRDAFISHSFAPHNDINKNVLLNVGAIGVAYKQIAPAPFEINAVRLSRPPQREYPSRYIYRISEWESETSRRLYCLSCRSRHAASALSSSLSRFPPQHHHRHVAYTTTRYARTTPLQGTACTCERSRVATLVSFLILLLHSTPRMPSIPFSQHKPERRKPTSSTLVQKGEDKLK